MSMTVHPRETRPHRSTRRDPPHDVGEAAQDARCWARLQGPARLPAQDELIRMASTASEPEWRAFLARYGIIDGPARHVVRDGDIVEVASGAKWSLRETARG